MLEIKINENENAARIIVVGVGGGFYDRYLSIDNTFIKAALAFDFQLLEAIPYEEHDLKPDYIITQTQFIRRDN